MKHLSKALAALLLLSFASACAPSPEALTRYQPPDPVEVTFFFLAFETGTNQRAEVPLTALVVTPGYEREVLHFNAPYELRYNSEDRRGVEDYTSVTASVDAGSGATDLICWWVANSNGVQYTSENAPGGEDSRSDGATVTCTFDGLVHAKLREARQRDLDVLDHDGGSSAN